MVELLIDILTNSGIDVMDKFEVLDKTIVNKRIIVDDNEINIYTSSGIIGISFIEDLDFKTRRYFAEDFINLNIHLIVG